MFRYSLILIGALVLAGTGEKPAHAQVKLSQYYFCFYGGGFLEPKYYTAVFEYNGDIKNQVAFREKAKVDFKAALHKNFQLHPRFSDPSQKISVKCNIYPQKRDSREQVQSIIDRQLAKPASKGFYKTDWVPGKVKINSKFYSRK